MQAVIGFQDPGPGPLGLAGPGPSVHGPRDPRVMGRKSVNGPDTAAFPTSPVLSTGVPGIF